MISRAGGFGEMGVFGACFPKNDPLVPIDFTLEGEEFGGVTPKMTLKFSQIRQP